MSEQKSGRSLVQTARLGYRVVVIALLVAVFVVFVLVNSQKVTVDFVLDDVRMQLAFALLIAGGLGFGAGLLFSWNRRR